MDTPKTPYGELPEENVANVILRGVNVVLESPPCTAVVRTEPRPIDHEGCTLPRPGSSSGTQSRSSFQLRIPLDSNLQIRPKGGMDHDPFGALAPAVTTDPECRYVATAPPVGRARISLPGPALRPLPHRASDVRQLGDA